MSWDFSLEVEVDGIAVWITDDINYTHNCNPMIRAAGFEAWPHVYGWRAGSVGLILGHTLSKMRADPAKFRAMNPANGWGDYDGLLQVLDRIHADCETFPSATVRVSA